MALWPNRRVVLVLAVLLPALAAAGLIAVRMVLDRAIVRQAAEGWLSTLLAQPVSIGGMRVSFLPLPTLIGSEISVGREREAPELALQRIRITPRLASLFGNVPVIREVTLEGLTVRVVREPPGRWRFPPIMPVPSGGAAGQVVIERVRLKGGRVRVFEFSERNGMQERSNIDDVEGEAVADAAVLRVSPIRGRVGGAEIRGDAVLDDEAALINFAVPEIKNDDLRAVLGLAAAAPPESMRLPRAASGSLSIRIDRRTFRLSGTGSLRAPEVAFDSLRLDNLVAPLKTDGARLTFEPITFNVYGGMHRGTVVIDLSHTPSRWSLNGRVADLEVGKFLAGLTGRDQRLDGTAAIVASLRGHVGEPLDRDLAGRVELKVTNGIIREFPLLAVINRTLRLAEGDLRDTRFERLAATLTFGSRPGRAGASPSGYASTDDLMLLAREVRVEAAGRIGFDRSLDLAGTAVMSRERTQSAVRSVHELSGLRNDRGELELPLTFSGSADDPSIGIDLKTAVRRSIMEELRRRLRGFRRNP